MATQLSSAQAPYCSDNQIFAAHKILVCCSTRVREQNSPEILVVYAPDRFLSNFGYRPESLPIPLDTLLSDEVNSPEIIIRVERSIQLETETSHFVNLFTNEGEVLSCHVSIDPVSLGTDSSSKSISVGLLQQRQAVLTIRNASLVGTKMLLSMGCSPVQDVDPRMFINDEGLEIIGNQNSSIRNNSVGLSSNPAKKKIVTPRLVREEVQPCKPTKRKLSETNKRTRQKIVSKLAELESNLFEPCVRPVASSPADNSCFQLPIAPLQSSPDDNMPKGVPIPQDAENSAHIEQYVYPGYNNLVPPVSSTALFLNTISDAQIHEKLTPWANTSIPISATEAQSRSKVEICHAQAALPVDVTDAADCSDEDLVFLGELLDISDPRFPSVDANVDLHTAIQQQHGSNDADTNNDLKYLSDAPWQQLTAETAVL